MIPYQEILSYSKEFPPEAIEKDYCLTWLLWGISRSILADDLVFYGGTAIKMIYQSRFRFSEDLDFLSIRVLSKKTIIKELKTAYKDVRTTVNINFETAADSIILKDDRLQLFVLFDGFPEISLDKKIKIDICQNQNLLEKPEKRKIRSPYSDKKLLNGELMTYSLEALTAEKIAAVFDSTRREPRDLYDLACLSGQKLEYKKVLFMLKKKYGFIPPLTSLLDNIESKIYSERWQIRLDNQVANLQNIDVTKNLLIRNLKNIYKGASAPR